MVQSQRVAKTGTRPILGLTRKSTNEISFSSTAFVIEMLLDANNEEKDMYINKTNTSGLNIILSTNLSLL